MKNTDRKIEYKGSALFKVISIIMLLFCIVSLAFHAVLFIITFKIAKAIPYIVPLVIAMILGAVGAVCGIIAGVDGIVYSKCPLKMNQCMIFDIAFMAATVISAILSSVAFKKIPDLAFMGVLVTALFFSLYLVCAYKCKKLEFENNISALEG